VNALRKSYITVTVKLARKSVISCSEGHPQRIARLIEKISIFDPARIKATLALADQFAKPLASDEDREVIRTVLRKRIYWHRNYDKVRGAALDKKLRAVGELYERLSPRDLLIRHRWLFAASWPEIPARVREDDHNKRAELLDTLRNEAFREVYADRGMLGVEQLATACANQPYAGVALAKLGLDKADLVEWIVERGGTSRLMNR
jgi:hypothetical protein